MGIQRRVQIALTAVVVGITTLTTRLFLTVTQIARLATICRITATTTLVSVLFAPAQLFLYGQENFRNPYKSF